MKININGIIRDMTEEEIKAFEEESSLLENNKAESDISERVKRLEQKTSDASSEITSLKNAFGAIKETLESLRNLTKL